MNIEVEAGGALKDVEKLVLVQILENNNIELIPYYSADEDVVGFTITDKEVE